MPPAGTHGRAGVAASPWSARCDARWTCSPPTCSTPRWPTRSRPPRRREWRAERGIDLGWWQRRRLARAARRLLRPGAPPPTCTPPSSWPTASARSGRCWPGAARDRSCPPGLDEAEQAYLDAAEPLTWLAERLAGTPGRGRPRRHRPRACWPAGWSCSASGRRPCRSSRGRSRCASGCAAPVWSRCWPTWPAGTSRAPDVGAELELVWWTSVLEDLAVGDPRYGAHDGDLLRQVAAEFGAADREHVAQRRRAGAPGHRRAAGRRAGPAPRAGRAAARRGGQAAPAPPAARPGRRRPRRAGRGQAVLGAEPAGGLPGAAARPAVRRRGVRRGVPGAAGPGGRGDQPGPAGGRRRGRAAAAADRVLHQRRPGRRRRRRARRRAVHRGLRVGAGRAVREPAGRPAALALPVPGRAAGRLRQPARLRRVAGDLPGGRLGAGAGRSSRSTAAGCSRRTPSRWRAPTPRSPRWCGWSSSTPGPARTSRSASSRWVCGTPPGWTTRCG